MLIEAGADTQVMNKFGLTALHTAAQGDQPQTLYFFHKVHKMNINQVDTQGSTPLHWAIFSQSELAVVYIIAWMNDMNLPLDAQDDKGNTVMHLAVNVSEELESTRMVKQLLFNAAPKDIKNERGELPTDLARNMENEEIGQACVELLERKQTLAECIQMEKPN